MSLSPFTSLSTNNQLLNLIIHIIHPKPNNGMKTLTSITLLPMLLVACTSKQEFQPSGDPIRINQVGYYTKESKTAVIEEDGFCDTYQLKDLSTSQVVWEGKSVRTSTSPWSEKKHEVVDFSSVTKPGKYLLVAGNYSKQVNIEDHPYRALSVAALKAFYYQRSGEPIEAEYAGQWARPAGHLDTTVLVHPSAESKGRPAGTVLSSPGGWYDAGDYNKYIVNSGFTIGEILTIYQCCPGYFKTLNTNIPESSNELPDVLDEMLVNLKWMLSMQDPTDGGVYHKLTNPDFEGFVMPTDCHQQRYVVQKSTAATLDFIATMALASRIYRKYDAHKEFAQQALNAAMKAWSWARLHPKVVYSQMELNKKFDPKVNTGEYGDWRFDDEFFWAATELYITTSKRMFLNEAARHASKDYFLPTWGHVSGLAAMEWMIQGSFGYSPEAERFGNKYGKMVIAYCDSVLQNTTNSIYDSPYGNSPFNFGWGCLGESCCGHGLSFLFAHKMSNDPKYLAAAIKCADYLLGRNATGYCYVTGFGLKPSMHPHHRLSEADSIEAPIPGLLVGGPNPAQQDKVEGYPSNYPDESYVDITESYASNEIAINWNAGLCAFIGWLDAEVK